MRPRIVIVGGGGAALSAAIEAAKYDVEIFIVMKGYYNRQSYKWASNGGCTWKTHGFNAVISEVDSIESHIHDTMKGGAFANNETLVKTLCYGARELVDWLENLGIEFDANGKKIETRPFGGCETPRSVYIEDRLGFYIQKAFCQKINDEITYGKIKILENFRALSLLKDQNGELIGLEILDPDTLELIDISCDSVIIADGGGASMYSPSAASSDKTCDGIVMALEAEIEIIDMEFVQFHPTGIVTNVAVFDGSLVEEILRFDGAQLINKHNNRFMFSYNSLGEIATRDEVSRGIYSEIIKGNGFEDNSVLLNISDCKTIIQKRYPALNERLRQAGYDSSVVSSIPVRPTAHFLMGGIKIDEHARTSFQGVYSAGESAGGVHGANRLGGNGLSEALVFGRIAGNHAAEFSLAKQISTKKAINISGALHVKSNKPVYTPDSLLNKLRKSMYWFAGPVKTDVKLQKMLNIIAEMKPKLDEIDICTGSRSSYQIQQYLDLKNLISASELILEAAILRKKNIGSHYKEGLKDFVECFDEMQLS